MSRNIVVCKSDAYYDGGMAPVYYDGQLANADWEMMIGTGPFMIESMNEAEGTIVMVKNPNYWGGNMDSTHRTAPIDSDIDQLIVKRYLDDAAFFTAILDGEIDYWDGSGTWLDYEDQMRESEFITMSDPLKAQSSTSYALGLQGTDVPGFGTHPNPTGTTPLDYTLRYAMNFAFNYDHYLTPEICGSEVIRNN